MNLFKQEDTIVALATGNIKAALAIIRISGKLSKEVVSSIFKTKNFKSIELEDKKVLHGYICDNQKKLDEVILFYMKSPNTYTGEDTVEISTHGNPLIVQQIIELLLSKNIRMADRGEFTYRAFINGKIDLSEAEAVNVLINSNSSKATEFALSSLQGSLSNQIKQIKQDLTTLFAYLEVSLDYPEEDIDFLTREQKKENIQKIISKIDSLISSYSLSKLIVDGIKIVIVGKPNVGKSSILNSILGYKRAIVTDIAGTTTDTIEETVEYNGVAITIIDTAGIRYHTNNIIEQFGQDRAKSSIGIADIILWVIDSNIDLDDNDKQIANILKDKKDKTVVVLNKIDLEQKICKEKLNNIFITNTIINFSTINKTPIEKILNKIFEKLNIKDIKETKIFLNTRQYNLICKAQQNLKKIYNLINKGDSDEIVSFETQNVLSSLNEILGCYVKEDVLQTVFSKFCVGK